MNDHQLEKTYLQLLPLHHEDKIDIFAVFNGIYPQITKWVEQLLTNATWESDIHVEFNYPDLFRHFYFESKNIQKTVGQYAFGFGFPMIFDIGTEMKNTPEDSLAPVTVSGEVISAPLFIWYLQIRPNPNRADSWIISFEDNSPIVPNEYLLRHIQNKYNIDLIDFFYEFSAKKPVNIEDLVEFCKELSRRLGFQNDNFNLALRDCPSTALLKIQAGKGDINWCGALGLFPHQNGSLAEGQLKDIDFQNFTWTAEHVHEFAALPEDAHQRAALRTVLRNKITIVEGAHGTGKTHLATNILLNALSNGQKTAVVANDIGSLMQIQNEFVKLGLGNLTFLLKDIFHDKKLLLDVLRNEQYGKAIDFKEDDFKITLKQARRLLVKSDDSHDALSRSIFGEDNFAEVVGFFAQSQNIEGRELLANHLEASDYEFTKEEYDNLVAAIKVSEDLYKNVNTLKHPLSSLHPEIFENVKSGNGREFAKRQLAQLIEQWKALHLHYITVYDAYAQKLMAHYEAHYNDLQAQVRLLKESNSDYKFQFGDSFESNNFFRISGLVATSMFSDKSKNVLTAKDEVISQYDTLSTLFNSRKHFTHIFLKDAGKKDIKKLQINLDTFELALKSWRKALPSTVQEELQRLNAKTAQYFDKDLSAEIKTLENSLEDLLKLTNDTHLYAATLSHKMLTLPKRMLFIEDTIEKLEETQLNMRDFDTFYSWQRNWLNMPPNGRKLIQSLIKVKPNDWSAAFQSWYLYNTLVGHYQSNTLGNDDLMNQMFEVESKLRQMLPTQIAYVWNERKKEAIRAFKSQNSTGHKFFFNAKNQTLAKNKFLKQILKNSINTLSEIYPVLLVTPQVATQIIESEGKEFDLVVFDNSQNIDSEVVVPILRNTEGVVVMTEFSQLDSIPTDSFAAQLKSFNAATVRLNHLHRPVSETARRLNQSIFYPDLEVPFKSLPVAQTVSVVHIQGKYSEKTHANEKEITEIVRILEKIHANPFNTFPRIGIVCLNKLHRNALSNALLNIVQKSLPSYDKIEQLQRNGLGIYSLEELAGMQFDVLVVSGTYDSFDKMSVTRQDLRKLVNCFTQNLYWVNSIPREELAQAGQNQNNEGAFLLANLIHLAETVHLKDTPVYDEYDKVFDTLKSIYVKPEIVKDSAFITQVVITLSRFIEPEYLKTNYTIENQLCPLVILPKYDGQMPVVVRIDGKLSQGRYFSPTWERRILNELDKMNIPVCSIWSYNWWKDPKGEAFHLAQQVFAYDKNFEKVETMEEKEETVG